MKTVAVDVDMLTPFGEGLDACWDGLRDGVGMVSKVDRFSTEAFPCHLAACIPGLRYHAGPSLVEQMLQALQKRAVAIPEDAYLMLATTTGEVDLLEETILSDTTDTRAGALDVLLNKCCDLFALNTGGTVVSAACASSTVALGLAAASIESGSRDCVLIVACDAVTEFVFTGFSSLMALDPEGARPFAAERKGLSIGEGAGYILLMSEKRAQRENRPILGQIAGWGLSNDANHMTGPARDGEGLARAVAKSLRTAQMAPERVGFVCAHGTGTLYNDAMEMSAFKRIWSQPCPTFSIKGAMGHAMGATGLLEAALSLRALQESVVLATTNVQHVADEALGWVTTEAQPCHTDMALSTNSGFGGVNAAVLFKRGQGDV